MKKSLPESSPKFGEWLQRTLNYLEEASKARGHPNHPPPYRPYPKQILFHEAGRTHRERLLVQGNYGSSATQTAQSAVNPLAGTLGLGRSGFDPLGAIGSLAAAFMAQP